MVDEEGSEVASPDGNGHYEHAPLIVHRHETKAERASSSTRRPALIHAARENRDWRGISFSFLFY